MARSLGTNYINSWTLLPSITVFPHIHLLDTLKDYELHFLHRPGAGPSFEHNVINLLATWKCSNDSKAIIVIFMGFRCELYALFL